MAETTDTATSTDSPWAPWFARMAASRRRRDDRIADWQENVERRSGYINRSTDHYNSFSAKVTSGVAVNKDWPLTKAKIAQLYSQTPEVRLQPRWPEFQKAVPIFSRELNDTISDICVGATIEEVLADVVNAAGIGAVIVTCEKRTVPKLMPVDPATLPPEMQQAVMAGAELPTEEVEDTADIQYLCERVSPGDLLIPSDFKRSDYDKSRWLGRDGAMTWPQATIDLGLTDDQKDKVLGKDKRAKDTSKSLNPDASQFHDTDVVNYTELFYWRHFYHADETNFKAIQRLVFVDGLEEPVVNEPYRAQHLDEQTGRMLGVTRLPIRVCTLTYISDEGLPPSDSTIGRYQVNELEESRTDIGLQRRHSVPMRWGDTNRVSANTRTLLEKGEHQTIIWTNGPGDRALGEVARASYPPENFEFDKVINNDLTEMWQVGSNQAGAFATGERSAREAGIIQQNFQRRVGQEQDKVSRFFLGIAEVLAGHIAIYGTTELPDELGPQRQALANSFTYSIRTDSTVRLDAQQQIDRLEHMIDRMAQSPFADVRPLMAKWLELQDVDPTTVLIEPKPKPPEPCNISLKGEDLLNPMALAFTYRTGQGPSPEDLTASIKAFQAAIQAVVSGQMPMPPTGAKEEGPPREGETPGMANSDWQMAPRQDKREQDAAV